MAQTFCTGPVHVAFGVGGAITPAGDAGSGTGVYYGTTRTGPDISEEPSYFNVMNDLAGPQLPFDRGYAGSEHTLTLEMTRWDGSIDGDLNARPFRGFGGSLSLSGNENANHRGTMVSALARLHLQFYLSNGGVGFATPAFLIRWRRYHQVVNVGPDRPIWGNKENVRVRIFKAQNVFVGVNLTNLNLPAFRLFDENTTNPPWSFVVS